MQYDFDLREIDKCELGYMEEYDLVFFENKSKYLTNKNCVGVLATADKFSENREEIKYLQSIGCNLKDMEGSAISQVCKANNMELVMIKAISDVIDSGSMVEQYLQNVKIASKNLIDYLEEIL